MLRRRRQQDAAAPTPEPVRTRRQKASPELQAVIDSVPHWYHRIELAPGVLTPGINDSQTVLRDLDWPEDWTGLRVLDLGTRDGFFAFEAERRGAEVTAVDYLPATSTGFSAAAQVLGSKVTFLQANVYKLDPEELGTFDVVLFLGLLYHLPDPLGALDVVRSLCRQRMYLETQVIDEAFQLADGSRVPLGRLSRQLLDTPIMQFYPAGSLNSDNTNYWAANSRCLTDMLTTAGFVVEKLDVSGQRAIVRCSTASDPEREYYRAIARGDQHPVVHDIAATAAEQARDPQA
jgi:tRNA (mo5U34)-methyltransferase